MNAVAAMTPAKKVAMKATTSSQLLGGSSSGWSGDMGVLMGILMPDAFDDQAFL
jgi:hypothetical protein